MARHRVLVEQGDGWLVAVVPALPGVLTQGRDEDELRFMVLDALRLMVADAVERSDDAFLRAAGDEPWELDLEYDTPARAPSAA